MTTDKLGEEQAKLSRFAEAFSKYDITRVGIWGFKTSVVMTFSVELICDLKANGFKQVVSQAPFRMELEGMGLTVEVAP